MSLTPDSIGRLRKGTIQEFVVYQRRKAHLQVRRYRAELQLTRERLAALLNVSVGTIVNYEDTESQSSVPDHIVSTLEAMVELQREKKVGAM